MEVKEGGFRVKVFWKRNLWRECKIVQGMKGEKSFSGTRTAQNHATSNKNMKG